MTVEADIVTLLKTVTSKVYPDVAPMGTEPPYITFQQVGGESLTFLDRTVPSKKNGRYQIGVWTTTRLATAAIALQVENAFIAATAFQAEPQGSPIAAYENETEFYGSHQDFSVWSAR